MNRSTLDEVRNALESNGLSISEWAATNGFRRENVYAVLAGRSRGRRGEAHRIALALGLKEPIPLPTVSGRPVQTTAEQHATTAGPANTCCPRF